MIIVHKVYLSNSDLLPQRIMLTGKLELEIVMKGGNYHD